MAPEKLLRTKLVQVLCMMQRVATDSASRLERGLSVVRRVECG